jgi:broad specificity phosphatase PhoE
VQVRNGRATVTGTAVPAVRNSTAANPRMERDAESRGGHADAGRRAPGLELQWQLRRPVRRLLLVRHGCTAATRAGAFPGDEELDERGSTAAAALAGVLGGRPVDVLSSPARRCLQTAAAAGLPEPSVEPALAECDFGTWACRTLADVHAEDADAVATWMADPAAAPHGGEALAGFARRVATWLDEQARLDGRAVVVTHGGVIKASVVHALGAPPAAFWKIDAAPLAVTELHAHDGRWTLTRANCTTASDGGGDA